MIWLLAAVLFVQDSNAEAPPPGLRIKPPTASQTADCARRNPVDGFVAATLRCRIAGGKPTDCSVQNGSRLTPTERNLALCIMRKTEYEWEAGRHRRGHLADHLWTALT